MKLITGTQSELNQLLGSKSQGGIIDFALWERAFFVKYFAWDSVICRISYWYNFDINSREMPHYSWNRSNLLYLSFLKDKYIGCLVTFLHLTSYFLIFHCKSVISNKYFAWGKRSLGNLVLRFPVIIPPYPFYNPNLAMGSICKMSNSNIV